MNLRVLATLIAAALLIASLPAAAGQANTSPNAQPAKAKKKKKKKKRRARPPAPATVPTGSVPTTPPPVTCADDAAEPNDTTSTASFLSLTDPTANRFLCPADSDFYRVDVESGYLIRITVDPGAFNAKLELYDGNGNWWGTVDDHGPGVAEFIEHDASYGGPTQTHYVEATATTPEGTGDYTVRAVAVLSP